MKKKEERRYGLLKGILIMILIAFVLTWIIPTGGYTSTGYTEIGMTRLGLYDIAYTIYYALSFGIDKIVVLIAIALFYGVLTRTSAYDRIVSGIAKKLNKKLAVVLFSTIIAILTSLLTQTFVVLIFIPFIISILNRMKLDKITILATTFGAVLVGLMGATYGTDGISMFNYYLGFTTASPDSLPYSIPPALLVRAGILVIGLILFNFFTLTHISKQDEKNEDALIFDEQVDSERELKTKNRIPIIIIGVILLILVVLGFVNWNDNFGIEVFDDFHELITEDIKIGDDFYIFKNLLGTGLTAFGSWNNITISAVLLLFTFILALCYRFKVSDFVEASISSLKKIIVPSLCIVGAYMLMIVVYQSTYVATIVSKLLTITESFNIATMSLSALILNIFHTDLGFTGWVMGAFLPVEYVDYMNPVYTIFTSLYGFVQFFIPTSMVLGIGLVSLKVKYSDWLKYIWRFLLGMFICLLVIFILMSII